ncbi:aminopeptidase N [Aureimonas fodinaquatilis]|uniref:Aminopeptidase N n=1 Tax=Aureimonas fodinaquatilis TaxID=2565783 RepID=A0A5B0DXG4_9HYPH|nr:aminopeptidase N [Aureimonas fodinaquatilis]KAA0971048.1 aminopeptidase N [Aureimonas fodinaquatilis]
MRAENGQIIKLEDYLPADFVIHQVDMTFDLRDGHADVLTRLVMQRREGVAAEAPLELDGDELSLTSLALNGTPVSPQNYTVAPDSLKIDDLPAQDQFTLEIGTRLHPEQNTKLMGLYRSNGIWCTQCEAQGFRRITYFLDRPDVLATYKVRLEADKAAAPVLLANGNPVASGDLPNGRHFAEWIDPHLKPSYLFAIVGGRLDVLKDSLTTISGRHVELAIYTEPGLAERATYAMDALKRSMWWDERRFGREYDLDVFNIVAISDFNMGAMENKGLNVFNHKYVLLDSETATDADYAGVETVIAHEYFHNWTGNRITCRDWFQLCLKEGLTVYRDQEFSSDERSRPVKRISCVHTLKANQFPEDQGPLQHPVRPTTYREINNFYTATVYDKGSELVRMLATILGEDKFRAGMDLYFERHDGDAATIEDFIACFAQTANMDLSQFALWYNQAGTPRLTVSQSYDAKAGTLTLNLQQQLDKGAAGTGTLPMHIPVRFGLVGANGQDIAAEAASDDARVSGDTIHLTTASATIVFTGLNQRPLLSILRDFSAPVQLQYEESEADRLALARLDPDAYGRWRALTDLVGDSLADAARQWAKSGPQTVSDTVLGAIVEAADDTSLEPALRAQMCSLPGETEIARLVAEDVNPEIIHTLRLQTLARLGMLGGETFRSLRAELAEPAGEFSASAASAGRRALRNCLLAPLSAAAGRPDDAAKQYAQATNMSDRMAALTVLVHQFPQELVSQDALTDFYNRFESDPLVLDKWFALQAASPNADTLERVEALLHHEKFKLANPNRARAVIGGLAGANPSVFHRADGAGYRWVCGVLLQLDSLNPQTAARMATAFRSWRSMNPALRQQAEAALRQLAASENLSRDLRDIVERTLK